MFSWLKLGQRSQQLVGVEVRPEGLGVAVSSVRSGTVKIEHCDFLDVKPARRLDSLREKVNELKLEKAPCNLVLPPEQYSLMQIDRPAVEEQELRNAVSWKVKDLLDYPLEDSVIDAFEFPQDALRGRPPQANVVSARKAMVQDLVTLVKESGLQLQSIDITELALRNIAARFEEESKSLATLLMHGNSGLMLLTKERSVYLSRRIDADLEALTDPERGEWVGQQLALEIQRSLDYFESQMGQVPPRRILAASTINETEMLSQLDTALGLDVLAISEDRVGLAEDQLADASHWVACGAALRLSDTEKKEAA